jgi:glycosyltransferase involved in cell wall biosynthesis
LKTTIVIPTRNRPADLSRCLDSIRIQSLLPDEVVIVDSSDPGKLAWKDITSRFKNLKLIFLHTNPGVSLQKNAGIEASTGDIIFFLDDDIILDRDFLKEIHAIFECDRESRVAGIGGEIINPGTSDSGKAKNIIDHVSAIVHTLVVAVFGLHKYIGRKKTTLKPGSPLNKPGVALTLFIPAGLSAWRKNALNEFRFDEYFNTSQIMEDADFSYRVSSKYWLLSASTARAVHNFSPIGRLDVKAYKKKEIETDYYLFKKNISQTFLHRMAYCWRITGFGVLALLLSIRSCNSGSLKGVIAGLASISKKKYNGKMG